MSFRNATDLSGQTDPKRDTKIKPDRSKLSYRVVQTDAFPAKDLARVETNRRHLSAQRVNLKR